MKRIIFFTTIICLMATLSCKKNNKPGNASFTSQFDFTVSIPIQPQPTVDTTIVAEATISIDDSRLETCDKASLKSFYIEIKEPAGQTFDFCKEAHLWLSAPGISEVDVISATNINANATRIDFTVSSVELVQFLRQKSMTAKVKVVLRKACVAPIKIYGNIVFNVQGKIQ